MYYIGIDLGTSAVKLLLMQGDGQIANIVSREYPIALCFSCGSLRFFFILPNFPLQVQERAYKIIDRSLDVLVFSPGQTLCNKK